MESSSAAPALASRFSRIEQRISEAQKLREEYEALLPEAADRPEERMRHQRRIEELERLLRHYLKAYLRMCTRLERRAPEQVQELAAELLGEAAPGPAPTEPPSAEPASMLPGVRVVRIAISQLFRMVDLLTYPDNVRAQTFVDTIRDPNAMRRAINRRKKFRLGNLGSIQPVAVQADDRFWAGSVPDLRLPGSSPLFFLPFELPLEGRLARLGVPPGPVLENQQIEARLRIYPPGTGVVQLSVTLTFREAVDVEAVGRIAQQLEDLLFVDPAGQERPSSAFFLDIIDQVERSLFLEPTRDRRWQPPHTVFSFRDAQAFDPGPHAGALARLMSLAPGNEERTGFLESRLREALASAHWEREGTLALAGQCVALLLAALEPRDRRVRRLSLLTETHELVSAAAYAEQAFINDLDEIVGQSRLDATWLPGQGNGFENLRRILETLREVMQAIASIRFHLQNQPVRLLNTFAKDIWIYGSPIRPELLRQRLDYLEDWYSRAGGPEPGKEIVDLLDGLRRIREIEPLFPYPEDQEDRLFDRLEQVYELLRGEEDRPEEVDQGLREARRLGRRLGL